MYEILVASKKLVDRLSQTLTGTARNFQCPTASGDNCRHTVSAYSRCTWNTTLYTGVFWWGIAVDYARRVLPVIGWLKLGIVITHECVANAANHLTAPA